MEFETIKAIYEYSINNVIVTDRDFNTIWSNINDVSKYLNYQNLKELMNPSGLEYVKSNLDTIKIRGRCFRYELLNVDTKDGILYIIIIMKEDILQMMLRNFVDYDKITKL